MTTLDRITRSLLIQKAFPMHYYLRFLKWGADCIRELSYDTIPCIQSEIFILNSYGAIDVPCNMQDIVRVGIEQGQFVQPVAQRNSATNLLNHNQSTGQVIPWGEGGPANSDYPYYPGYWMFQNIDDLGESLGRLYGWNTGLNNVWYKWIKERKQIQFSEEFPSPCVVLEWIGDGECINNVTQVDSYAIKTIEAYIDWQYKLHQRRPNLAEVETSRRNYSAEWRKLRARESQLDLVQIRQVLQRAYSGAPKNV